jgi:hypothetical protein
MRDGQQAAEQDDWDQLEPIGLGQGRVTEDGSLECPLEVREGAIWLLG